MRRNNKIAFLIACATISTQIISTGFISNAQVTENTSTTVINTQENYQNEITLSGTGYSPGVQSFKLKFDMENHKLKATDLRFPNNAMHPSFSNNQYIGLELIGKDGEIKDTFCMTGNDKIDRVNEINPYAFTIVDSAGAMKESDVLSTYYILDKNLNKEIAICFHSHNNLKLSFANAQALIKASSDRDLIIDSTVFGMGRAAGNLCTEVITQYINDHYKGNYNLIPILKILNEQINPIFDKTPWGYSVPYYLAAINSCHPSYAKYLDENKVAVEKINEVLKLIPEGNKYKYDELLIKKIMHC